MQTENNFFNKYFRLYSLGVGEKQTVIMINKTMYDSEIKIFEMSFNAFCRTYIMRFTVNTETEKVYQFLSGSDDVIRCSFCTLVKPKFI